MRPLVQAFLAQNAWSCIEAPRVRGVGVNPGPCSSCLVRCPVSGAVDGARQMTMARPFEGGFAALRLCATPECDPRCVTVRDSTSRGGQRVGLACDRRRTMRPVAAVKRRRWALRAGAVSGGRR